MIPTPETNVVIAEIKPLDVRGAKKSVDIPGVQWYTGVQDERIRQEGAPMSKEPKDPGQPLEIQSLADGESSVLGAFARIEADILDRHKSEPYWAERISKLKEGLTTPFAQKIAAYILRDEELYDDATPAEQSAWKLAEKMMSQVQPGYRQKIRHTEEEMTVTKSR
jgi:hypothetical protein